MAVGGGTGGGTGGGSGGPDPSAAAELAKAMEAAKSASAEVTRAFNQQLNVMLQMRDAMTQITKGMGALCSQDCAAMSAAEWEKVKKEIERTRRSTDTTTRATEGLAKTLRSSLTKGILVAAGAIDGLVQGFRNMVGMTKAIGGLFGSIASGAFGVAKSIISIPFKMMKGLFDMASKGGGGTELAQAYENVRKEFGSLSSSASQTIIGTAKSMGSLDSSGVSAFRIFGNLAQRIEAVNKLATAMGNTFINFQDEIASNGEAIMRYQKGLGIADDQMAGIARTAQRMGKSMGGVLNDMTKQSLGMAKAFGVNAKILSKDMAKAMQDTANFGSLSSKELAVAATYAQKLGVSVDKLTASMDATKTFDSTVDAVSKLNEAYGTNLDAAELMAEENPAKQQEMIRKALQATGKDMSKLGRHEKEMIKATGLMSDEMIDAAFASKNAGVSLDKISKQGDKNEKKTLTQAEAMEKLADSMERIVQSGGQGSSSIFGRIFEGMTAGIKSSQEFRDLMKNINQILMKAFQFGMKVGKAIMGLAPIKKIFGGLTELFDPARYQKMFDGVMDAINTFSVDGPNGMQNFVDKITGVFGDFVKSGIGPSSKIVEGFKMLGVLILKVLGKALNFVVDKMIEFVPKITEAIPKLFAFLKKPKEGEALPKISPPEWAKPFIDLFFKIKDILVPQIGTMLSTLWDEVWPIAKPYVIKGLKLFVLGAIGPSVFRSALGAVTGSITKIIGDGLMDAIGMPIEGGIGPISSKISSGLKSIGTKVQNFIGPNAGKMLGKVAIVAAIATAAVDVAGAMDKFGGELEKKGFDPATAKIAAGTTGLINTLTFGLLPEDMQMKIAEALAGISKAIFEEADKLFGAGFGDAMKMQMSGLFDIFGGLGNLIKALWDGDSAKADEAFGQIAEGLLDSFMGALASAVNIILKIGPLIIEKLMEVTSWLTNKLGDIFLALKDVPILGPLFELVGNLFKEISKFFDKAAEGWKMIGEFFKSLNITQVFKDAVDAVKNFFGATDDSVGSFRKACQDLNAAIKQPFIDAWNWLKENFSMEKFKQLGTDVLDGIVGGISSLGEKISGIFTGAIDGVKSLLGINSPSKVFEDMGGFLLDGLLGGIGNIGEKVTGLFGDAVDGVKSFLGISSPSKVFEDMGGNMVDGMMGMITEFPEKLKEKVAEVVGIVDEIFKMVTDSVRNNFNMVYDLIVEITDKVLGYFEKTLPRVIQLFQDTKDGIFKVFGLDIFTNLAKDILNGITEAFTGLKDKITAPFKDAVGGVKSFLGIASPSKVFEDMGGNMVDGMMSSIEEVPKKIQEAIAKVLEVVDKIFKDVSEIIKSKFREAISNVTSIVDELLGAFKAVFEKILDTIGETISMISRAIAKNVPKIIAVVSKITEAIEEAMDMIMPVVKKVFDNVFTLVSGITDKILGYLETNLPRGLKIFQNFKDGIFKIFGVEGFLKLFEDIVTGVQNALGKLADIGPFKDIISIAKKVFQISSPSKVFEDVGNNIVAGLDKSMQKLPATAEKHFDKTKVEAKEIGEIPTANIQKQAQKASGDLAPVLEKMNEAKELPVAAAAKTLKMFQAAVATIQAMDAALAQVPKINIAAKMAEAAGKLGLGSSGVYTVKSKEVVINVKFEVSMSASEVEKALIYRSESIIRDRINFALGGGQGESKIVDQTIPTTGPVGKAMVGVS